MRRGEDAGAGGEPACVADKGAEMVLTAKPVPLPSSRMLFGEMSPAQQHGPAAFDERRYMPSH